MSSTTSGRPSASTSATAIEAPAFSQGNQSGTGVKGVCIGNRSLEGGGGIPPQNPAGGNAPGGSGGQQAREPPAVGAGQWGQRVVARGCDGPCDGGPGQHLLRQRGAMDRLDQAAEDVGIRAGGGEEAGRRRVRGGCLTPLAQRDHLRDPPPVGTNLVPVVGRDLLLGPRVPHLRERRGT